MLLLNELMIYLFFIIKNKNTVYNGKKEQLEQIFNTYIEFKNSIKDKPKYSVVNYNIISYTEFFDNINNIKRFNPFVIDYSDNIIVIKNIPIDIFKNNQYRLRKLIIGYIENVNYDNKTVKVFINHKNKNEFLFNVLQYSILDLNTILSFKLFNKTVERYLRKYNLKIPNDKKVILRRKKISIQRKMFSDAVNNYVYQYNKNDYFYIDIDKLKDVFSLNKALHDENNFYLIKNALKDVDKSKINNKYYYELLTYNSISDISNKDILSLLNDISYNSDLNQKNKHYKKIFSLIDKKELNLISELNNLSELKNSDEYKTYSFIKNKVNSDIININNSLKELSDIKESLYFRYDKFLLELSEYDEYSLYKSSFDGINERMNKHNSIHKVERPIEELNVYSEDMKTLYYLGE